LSIGWVNGSKPKFKECCSRGNMAEPNIWWKWSRPILVHVDSWIWIFIHGLNKVLEILAAPITLQDMERRVVRYSVTSGCKNPRIRVRKLGVSIRRKNPRPTRLAVASNIVPTDAQMLSGLQKSWYGSSEPVGCNTFKNF
jgi:hypothetical protein